MKNSDFYKYVNNISILVITTSGTLKRIYCPFNVYQKNAESEGCILSVEKIAILNNQICYIIDNQCQLYMNYIIIDDIL
ncbi:hypothetical protein C8P68_1112 [Mucilaginibacter yixingensis]|uniref:Uncharacterized protein n=1 Tax=Mucilaginibacter yixingensis TaxID=1295612 RepID=A0A2T5J4U7_9SPHI|nr:hypothetical protein C8P68_1112 [Mucilaginibacter yixingensis]